MNEVSSLAPEPIEVEVLSGRRVVRIQWDDGHESLYDLAYLRGFCPCAVCQGHAAGLRYVPNAGPEITAIHEVGNYALNIVFEDGHKTGIYTFDMLRMLCPCQMCQEQQGTAHPLSHDKNGGNPQ